MLNSSETVLVSEMSGYPERTLHWSLGWWWSRVHVAPTISVRSTPGKQKILLANWILLLLLPPTTEAWPALPRFPWSSYPNFTASVLRSTLHLPPPFHHGSASPGSLLPSLLWFSFFFTYSPNFDSAACLFKSVTVNQGHPEIFVTGARQY